MSRDVSLVQQDAARAEVVVAALHKGAPVYVVSRDEAKYLGTVDHDALLRAGEEAVTAGDLMRPSLTLKRTDSLATAVARSGNEEAISFPVLSDEGTVAGFVTVKKIMNAYQGALDRVVREERSFAE